MNKELILSNEKLLAEIKSRTDSEENRRAIKIFNTVKTDLLENKKKYISSLNMTHKSTFVEDDNAFVYCMINIRMLPSFMYGNELIINDIDFAIPKDPITNDNKEHSFKIILTPFGNSINSYIDKTKIIPLDAPTKEQIEYRKQIEGLHKQVSITHQIKLINDFINLIFYN